MAVILQLESGSVPGQEYQIEMNQSCKVGSGESADFLIADSKLCPLHFSVSYDGLDCLVRNLSFETGTFINDRQIIEDVVQKGEYILAGGSIFSAKIEEKGGQKNDATPGPKGSGAIVARKRNTSKSGPMSVLDRLDSYENLYAILDTARTSRVYFLLEDCEEFHQSLYPTPISEEEEDLENVSPFLVKFSPGSPFLEKIVREGWGNSWGLYFVSEKDFAEVYSHFQQYITITTEEGEEMYFRFYDPRVAKVFLPSCPREDLQKFFGPVSCFLMEDEKSNIMQKYTITEEELTQEEISVISSNKSLSEN